MLYLTVLLIQKMYNSCIYGANLYDLSHGTVQNLFTSYNNSIRLTWSLPRTTHKYWVEALSGTHLATQLKANQLSFLNRVRHSDKIISRLLFQSSKDNLLSTTGSNLRLLKEEAIKANIISKHDNVLTVSPKLFKQQVHYEPFPADERYRLHMMNELLSIRDREMLFNDIDFEDEYFTDIINFLCND